MATIKPFFRRHNTKEFVTPFGSVLGNYKGVDGYSNGNDHHFSAEMSIENSRFYGVKYQCVEYARRWLSHVKNLTFGSLPHAADVWNLRFLEDVDTGRLFPLHKFANGSTTTLPKADMIMIWDRSQHSPVGHIAIIAEVNLEKSYVRVAEQNLLNDIWPGNYARELNLVIKNGKAFVEDEDPILGWMEVDHDPSDLSRSIGAEDIIKRITFTPKTSNSDWLDLSDPVYKYFSQLWGEASTRADKEEEVSYYRFNHHFAEKIKNATMEVHRLFYWATEAVIHDDKLLSKFGIPEEFWSLYRSSWDSNPGEGYMMGRFDLAFNGSQLKVLEFNADCPAVLLETAEIQDRWSKSVGCNEGTSAGELLSGCLTEYWKSQNINYRVHFLIDTDPEEMYNALYMQKLVKAIGIDSIISVRNEGLVWKDDQIYDQDGHQVKLVWKMWMWETILADLQEDQKNPSPKEGKPRLSHVMFHPNIRVIQPLWRSISANKALLAVLWQMFPNHPFLLEADWHINENLAKGPFVKKPVVGRCGKNVSLYNHKDHILEEMDGEFGDRDCIYQQFFKIAPYDGYYPIIGSWYVNKRFGFAGFGIREEKRLITVGDSPFACCRIVD